MKCPSCGHDNIAGVDMCEDCEQPLTQLGTKAETYTPLEEHIRSDSLAELKPTTPTTVSPNDTIANALELMAKRNTGYALVVWCDALIGIITERDVLMKIGTRYKEVSQAPVRHYMTPVPETLTEQDPIAFALNRMAVGGFRHVPITRDNRPIGVVSVRDVLGYVTEQFPEILSGTG